ncbi:MAG: amidohydrolase [Chloroflexota bacterium]|nr:amidohydrolase [Chloroflexota bacterium]
MPNFLAEAQELFEYTRELRRDFHRHPELGFREVRTAKIVDQELRALGLDTSTGIAETGVVALIEGAQPGPVVLLRFDMDALPIEEETGAEYASENPGVMHACGHDGHVAIGLTAARMLHARREKLAGTIKLVFQPAEEGAGGAERMVAEGVLENPTPDYSLALHLWNEQPLGWLGITEGPIMAAAEAFSINLIGKGGHGAAPHQTVDPILAAAQIIINLQSIVSRNIPPLESAVVSVCNVHGGSATNIIPPAVKIQGTIRSFEPDIRALILKRFREIVSNSAKALNCKAKIELHDVTSAVVNNPVVARRVASIAADTLPDSTVDSTAQTMGAEDMAFMMQDIPACFCLIGSANAEKGLDFAHHHPCFDFDETAMTHGAALITATAVDLLKGK